MSRVLVAWELGSGYGHLPAMALLADRLRLAGHAVCAAVPRQSSARAALGVDVLEIYSAPNLRECPQPRSAAAFNDVLARAGFDDADEVDALVDHWRGVLTEARVDALVADHAPMALLAARSLGLPAMAIGTGFVCPPSGVPLPPMRAVDEAALAACRTREDAMAAVWNDVLSKYGATPLGSLAALFNDTSPLLLTWPSLDPFAALRTDEQHLGAPPEPPGAALHAAPPSWPTAGVGRLFAYLRPDWVALPALAESLAASGHACVLHVPGASPALRDRLAAPNVAVVTSAVDMADDIETCDLVVGHGGHALTAAALLAGCPMLVLPSHLEQSLTGNCLRQLGAGIVVDSSAGRSGFSEALERLLSEDTYVDRACAFAEQHQVADPRAVDKRIDALVPG